MTQKTMTIDFVAPWGETFRKATAKLSQYGDGTQALQVVSDIGEPLTTASLNITAYGYLPEPGCIFVGDYSQHKGILEALQRAAVLIPTGRTVTFGPHKTTAREARIAPELIG